MWPHFLKHCWFAFICLLLIQGVLKYILFTHHMSIPLWDFPLHLCFSISFCIIWIIPIVFLKTAVKLVFLSFYLQDFNPTFIFCEFFWAAQSILKLLDQNNTTTTCQLITVLREFSMILVLETAALCLRFFFSPADCSSLSVFYYKVED